MLLQSFSWFWQWKNFESRLIFDKVKAFNFNIKLCHFWATVGLQGPPTQLAYSNTYKLISKLNVIYRVRRHSRINVFSSFHNSLCSVVLPGKNGKWLPDFIERLKASAWHQLYLPLLPFTHARSESINADGRLIFTARCTLVQSAVLRSHVVCLSVCDVGGLWSHRLEFFENNFIIS